MNVWIKIVLAVFCLVGTDANATQLKVGVPLSGFQCYHTDPVKLHQSREDVWAGHGSPPVFDQPSVDSTKLGVVPGLVFVAWPLNEINGFVQMVRVNGQIGWIAKDVIRPLYRSSGSTGGCTLTWGKDGLIRNHLDPGAKAWFWPDGHDMPPNMSH